MKLTELHHETVEGRMAFDCAVEKPDGALVRLGFTIEPAPDGLVLDRADAFVLPCLLLAMAEGVDLEIVPPVSAKLLYSANHNLVPVLARMLSLSGQTRTRASQPVSRPYGDNPGVVAGFSGGIDSFSCLHDHYFEPMVPGSRITHLLFNDVGSHGELLANRKTAEGLATAEGFYVARLERIQQMADELGLPLIRIRSNMDRILPIRFQSTHSARNAAAAMLMQSLCSTFLYSSGYSYQDIHVRPTRDIAHADPILLPMYSTESMSCWSVGCEHSRVEKTRTVAAMPLARQALDVCWLPRGKYINCGRCGKCKRTLLTLEILGCLDDFAEAFCLDSWSAVRSHYLAHVLDSDFPLDREIVELASASQYSFGAATHLRRHIWRLPFLNTVPAWVKRPFKRMLGY